MTRNVALLLTMATGFSGLAYEVTWEKFLAILLGSHSEATAAVLGIFLGGLSVGYALFGRVTRWRVANAAREAREPRLLLLYGGVEAGIGLYVILFPFLFDLAQKLSLLAPSGSPALAFAFDVVLTALLIGPPTVLMGGTIPVLTQALARSVEDATRLHALVYAFNTAGAFAGALAAGFFLVPRLGLVGVMFAMGSINLAAGAVFALLGARAAFAPELDEDESGEAPVAGFAWYAATALLLGFAMMSIQTVSIRLGGLALGSTQFTFSMVVAVFVLCIALGSMAVSAFSRVPRWLLLATLWALAALLYGLYPLVPESLFGAHVLRTLFTGQDAAFSAYHAAVFLALLALLGAPVLLSGAVLPLLFDKLKGESAQLGSSAGRLYSWNTVGSLLGALLGGYALLFFLDLHHVYRIATAAVVLAAVLITVRSYAVSPALAIGALLLPVLGALWLLGAWQPEMLSSGLYRERRATPFTALGAQAFLAEQALRRDVIFYDDDPSVSVAVVDQILAGAPPHPRALLSNGKPDGSTLGDYTTMALAALLPAALMDAPERAFVIGYGTGVTVGELAMLRSTRKVVVAEISAGVVAAAPLFDFANGGASKHPKVEILRSDAYRALRRGEGQYDIIVSEPSNPWMSGVEMLYSREFLEAARARLRSGGIYVQWLQQYESDESVVSLVLRTYASVFDHVAVWYSQGSDLLVLGIEDPLPALDVAAVARRTSQPDLAAGLLRAQIRSLPALLAHELMPVGVAHAMVWQGPLHTLRHPTLNFLAGRAFYRGLGSTLPFSGARAPAAVGARHSLLRRLADRSGGKLRDPDRSAALAEACKYRARLCAALVAEWMSESPNSPAARSALRNATGLQRRRFGGAVDADTVRSLTPLFAAAEKGDGQISPAAATRMTDRYRSYYQHAAPFDAQRLLEAWGRCRSPGSRACEAGRRRAAELLELPDS